MKIEKMAQLDAERWAAAEMMYGEGAGTARKLMNAELQSKFMDHPEYEPLFMQAYGRLDMNQFAKAAIKQRKALDRAAKAGQNFRALKSGNHANLSTGVFVVVGVAVVAHKTGYDKVITDKIKKVWQEKQMEQKLKKQASQILKLKYGSEDGAA